MYSRNTARGGERNQTGAAAPQHTQKRACENKYIGKSWGAALQASGRDISSSWGGESGDLGQAACTPEPGLSARPPHLGDFGAEARRELMEQWNLGPEAREGADRSRPRDPVVIRALLGHSGLSDFTKGNQQLPLELTC